MGRARLLHGRAQHRLLFYIDFMNDPIESVDNDGDGLFDEDGPDFPAVTDATSTTMGADDDGDCLEPTVPTVPRTPTGTGSFVTASYARIGSVRRPSCGTTAWTKIPMTRPSFRKRLTVRFCSVMANSACVPPRHFPSAVLATGLIRGEMTSETMHFLLAKPIARGEVLLYRMLGYLTLVAGKRHRGVPVGPVTGLAAPGEGSSASRTLGFGWPSSWPRGLRFSSTGCCSCRSA